MNTSSLSSQEIFPQLKEYWKTEQVVKLQAAFCTPVISSWTITHNLSKKKPKPTNKKSQTNKKKSKPNKHPKPPKWITEINTPPPLPAIDYWVGERHIFQKRWLFLYINNTQSHYLHLLVALVHNTHLLHTVSMRGCSRTSSCALMECYDLYGTWWRHMWPYVAFL